MSSSQTSHAATPKLQTTYKQAHGRSKSAGALLKSLMPLSKSKEAATTETTATSRIEGSKQLFDPPAVTEIAMKSQNSDMPSSFTAHFHRRHRPPPRAADTGDKENQRPCDSLFVTDAKVSTPIWAQFASQPLASSGSPHMMAEVYTGKDGHESSTAAGSLDRERIDGRKKSKVAEAIALFDPKITTNNTGDVLTNKAIDEAFEAILNARNIPEPMRHNMRMLDLKIKKDFIRHGQLDTPQGPADAVVRPGPSGIPAKAPLNQSPSKSSWLKGSSKVQQNVESTSPVKRGRPGSRGFGLNMGDRSPFKKARSLSRPRSIMSLKNTSSVSIASVASETSKDLSERCDSPEVYVDYLRSEPHPERVEVGKIHKLRILLRSGSISWTNAFISHDGMTELIGLLRRTMCVEWREEHEDMVMHEVLLCLKGLCTTEQGQLKLEGEAPRLFPDLLTMLFDKERRGPSEFATRAIIVNLLYIHLISSSPEVRCLRAKSILEYLSDSQDPESSEQAEFLKTMHTVRPYTRWNKEVFSVANEVFWIFLHHANVVHLINHPRPEGTTFLERHFPREKPPIPAAPYVGGVEWEATQYITSHLDLLNGLIASVEGQDERMALRNELRASGFEKTMGETLRTCKEKFYSYVHDALRTWIFAATEDQWMTEDVRAGKPRVPSGVTANSHQSGHSNVQIRDPNAAAPRIELPGLGTSAQGSELGHEPVITEWI